MAELESNPFVIEEGKVIEKASKLSKTTTFLSQTMAAMPVDKNKSFLISATIYQKKSSAQAAVGVAKKILVDSIASMKDCAFSCKTENDADGKYLGTRVWRIN